MTKKTQKTEPAEAGTGNLQAVGYKNPPKDTRFKKGQSGNPKGRPKTFDQLRALAQQVAAENLGESGLTRIQAMLTAMSTSRNPRDREIFLQYAFGKVKDEVAVTATIDKIEAYTYGDAVAALAPRPVEDSQSPSENKSDSDGETVGEDSNGG